ncbi:family 76 glycoside hydrolase [Stachybotrys elegans]|uniref:Mannan endo-1,6-alpha-mannosidase n=1 Tax=Stachybotrys elegans TaxID=80388 RepID=A0A8K0WV40_9HYPO|nr:family 76 glycoside hydrolase [Stachybotrys elegans]
MRSLSVPSVGAALLLTAQLSVAQGFSITSDDEIKRTASAIAWDLLQYYHGNETGQTPGILPGPPPAGDYYWWEAGAMWGTLIDYWALTGDSSYNSIIMEAMLFQTGDHRDYMPFNVTASLGNDDQGFWGLSAMLAAENNFPNPPSDKAQWLALAQAVYNTQANPDRHDETCGGGIRWQIPFANIGYDYKNSIANGCFFNLGARLARYTGNSSYSKTSEETWDWMERVGLLDAETLAVYDGAHVYTNCTDINKAQFSYNNAVWAQGAAFMYNFTNGEQKWKDRTEKIVNWGLKTFFPKGIAYELACEEAGTCTTDMLSFKGYLHRWYSVIAKVAPFMADTINPILESSAEAAVKQCTGGDNQRTCGFRWASGVFDGSVGAGQEMNVLAASSALLYKNFAGPFTAKQGGTSKGDVNAGQGSDDSPLELGKITTSDRAGAAFITILFLGIGCGMFGWMSLGE